MFQFRIDIIQPVMRRLDGILRHRHALHHLVMLFHFLFHLLPPEIGHPRAAEYSQPGTNKRPRQGQQRHNYSAVRNITSFLLRLQGCLLYTSGIPLRKAQKSRRPPNLKPEQNRQAKKGRKPPNLQTMRQITRSGGRARKTTADMQP